MAAQCAKTNTITNALEFSVAPDCDFYLLTDAGHSVLIAALSIEDQLLLLSYCLAMMVTAFGANLLMRFLLNR